MFARTPKIILLMFSFVLFSANALAVPGDQNWTALGGGVSGSDVTAIAGDGSNIYVGWQWTPNRIMKWNGTMWSTLGTMNDSVRALVVDSSGNVYAGGDFTTADGVTVNRVAKWDGTAWSALGTGMNGKVYALAVDSIGNVYAGGDFNFAGSVNAVAIAKWNGTAWSALSLSGLDGPNGGARALAIDSSNNLYAGGKFEVAGGLGVSHIAKWNGSSWSALGGGVGVFGAGFVYALAFDSSGNLYAGGDFNNADSYPGVSVGKIAKWNGSAWSALGTGMNGSYVYTLAIDSSGNLYAGGSFIAAGGVAASSIAKWNGGAWSALGAGVGWGAGTGIVKAMTFNGGGNLYVGGPFTTAGGVVVNYIAKWQTLKTKQDFNANTNSDVLMRNPSTGAWQSFLMNNASVSSSASLSINTSSDYVYQTQLDANGDGTADVLTRRTSTGAWILSTVVNNVVTNTTSLAMLNDPTWQYQASGDFNGDGTDDILIRNTGTLYWYVYYLKNGAVDSESFSIAIWNSANDMLQGVADFNNDGKAEVLMRNTAGLWSTYNFATGVTAGITGLWMSNSWAFQGLMDLNKDGIKDIVLRDVNAGDVNPGVWVAFTLNNSNTVTSAYGLNNVYRNLSVISLANTGDYDGNGTDDLLLRNTSNGAYYMFTTNTPAEASPGLQTLRAAPALYAVPWSVLK